MIAFHRVHEPGRWAHINRRFWMQSGGVGAPEAAPSSGSEAIRELVSINESRSLMYLAKSVGCHTGEHEMLSKASP